MNDHELAGWLAETAGKLVLAAREGPLEGKPLGFVGDQTANTFLMTALRSLRPEDAILSEESPDTGDRLNARRVWVVDPLDGTREYSERRSDWAVHVALTVDGVPVAGAVAQPGLDRTFVTSTVATPEAVERRPIMLVSRSRAPREAAALAEHLGAEIRAMGSAGAKALAIVAGEADIYYHSGGQHEWDNCAPAAVALAAGLQASRADGSPLIYNRRDTLVPDLIIARPDFGRRAADYIARVRK